eukprot:6195607-Pleurochrysis_carterae.AAC.1
MCACTRASAHASTCVRALACESARACVRVRACVARGRLTGPETGELARTAWREKRRDDSL